MTTVSHVMIVRNCEREGKGREMKNEMMWVILIEPKFWEMVRSGKEVMRTSNEAEGPTLRRVC